MRRANRIIRWLPAALALAVLVGCGAPPTATRSTSASQLKTQATATPAPAAASSGDPMGGDLNNNPIIIWIRQMHPKEGAQLIDDYISTKTVPGSNPTVEAQRAQLRQQALNTVTNEFYKNLAPALPPGLKASIVGNGIKVAGTTQQYGMDVWVAFDFTISIDTSGIIWIRQPSNSCKGKSTALLIKLLGGNLDQRVSEAVTDALNEQGPKNAVTVIGLSYYKGGTFRLDPGEAFINMPSLTGS